MKTVGADWIHVDVMDGAFVPNITIGPGVISAIRGWTDLPFDVHLMVDRPERYLEQFVEAGADFLTIHVEACKDIAGAIDKIRKLGATPGLSLNPDTPFSAVEAYLSSIDLLLIMTVPPGFGGQPFRRDCLSKVGDALGARDAHELDFEISVDGGIDRITGTECVAAGATVLAAGSALFKAPDMAAEIATWQRLDESIQSP